MEQYEYEREAARGDPMPDGLSLVDQLGYQAIRHLYANYRKGAVGREQAANEKAAILAQMREAKEAEILQKRITENHAKMWKNIEAAAKRFADERTVDAAEGFFKAVYGVGMKEE